jgi:hypothetical protein
MKWVLIAVGILIVVVAAVAIIGAMLPKNHLASRSSHFRQPPQAIWDVITGPPDWRQDIRSSEKLAPRDGRRSWKEIDKHGQAISYETIEETPPYRLVTRIADPKDPLRNNISNTECFGVFWWGDRPNRNQEAFLCSGQAAG